MNKWTIIVGSWLSGIELFGVFDTRKEAEDYAEEQTEWSEKEWHIVEIEDVE